MKDFHYIKEGHVLLTVSAEDITRADALAVEAGHKPNQMTVAVGWRFVVYDMDKSVVTRVNARPLEWRVHGGDVFESDVFNSLSEPTGQVLAAFKRYRYNPDTQLFIEAAMGRPTRHRFTNPFNWL